jgi:Fis family transcriptional regulator
MNETLIQSASLAQTARQLIEQHLQSSGNGVIDLHQMVLEQIEPPLLKAVMEQYKYNQSRAATALGISRGTMRTLLIKYFDAKYCGHRPEKDSL